MSAATIAVLATAAAAMPTSAGSVSKAYNAVAGDVQVVNASNCTGDSPQSPAPNINTVCFTVTPGEKTHIEIKDDHSAQASAQIQYQDTAGATSKVIGSIMFFCATIDVVIPDGAGVMYVSMTGSGTQVVPGQTSPPATPCGPGSGSATTGTVTVQGASIGNAAAASTRQGAQAVSVPSTAGAARPASGTAQAAGPAASQSRLRVNPNARPL
jgi:hypothetical protein